MAKSSKKSTRKFAASGALQKTIQARRKRQQIQKKTEKRQSAHKRGSIGSENVKESVRGHQSVGVDDQDDNGSSGDIEAGSRRFKGMSMDDFLSGGFVGSDTDGEGDDAEESELEDEEDGGDNVESDDDSFASIDELEGDEGLQHTHELSKLAENDPEFYKYLQENDAELLNFDPNAMDSEEEEFGNAATDANGNKSPVLTSQILKSWQKALLERYSLRALRKLLIAFRSASHMNEEGRVTSWSIESRSVFTKLVTTSFTYTPVVLDHHVPYKTLPSGRMKAPTQTTKLRTLQKLILSFFHNAIHIIGQLAEPEIIKLAVNESSKLLPYVINSRRSVKAYLKMCLDLWSTADDSVRISSYMAVKRLATSSDEGILDLVLKYMYLKLVRSTKATSVYTLPSINIMKNSASDVFCIDHTSAYQHAFNYIRQLAIHLRTSMKSKTKESYRQVYNWQFVHSVDFWSLVLSRACNTQATAEHAGGDSELRPLIFPLTQVAIGAIKLLNHSRSYPFHLQLLRSLVHLTQHTDTYIPLLPYLLPPLTAILTPSHKYKASTLRPFDFDTNLRAPQQYTNTRVYAEGVTEEYVFVLTEWLCTRVILGNIAFPELVVPLVVLLRKALKSSKAGKGAGKEAATIKTLVERVEESVRWIEIRRKGVPFSSGHLEDVTRWEVELREKLDECPLSKYKCVQRKAREKRRKLIEKARDGEDEILED